MGDMADWVNSHGDVDLITYDPERPGIVVCKYCGQSVRWALLDGKWRLFETTARHMCSAYWKKESYHGKGRKP